MLSKLAPMRSNSREKASLDHTYKSICKPHTLSKASRLYTNLHPTLSSLQKLELAIRNQRLRRQPSCGCRVGSVLQVLALSSFVYSASDSPPTLVPSSQTIPNPLLLSPILATK
ncbi:hypothetical protein JAAARDRAFT_430707 [Jaapia argillacea MUCL 33604]|uniref:Uncharacterized protein n=1 Tax=Jaapia argillacea MUCL 33604 TaxID=933084 RepID=A0A067PQQ9_9AGAM|nr:hypothetical protein JAAARDRAFT_430707 [Jaapia argillacea MUCL 33604]